MRIQQQNRAPHESRIQNYGIVVKSRIIELCNFLKCKITSKELAVAEKPNVSEEFHLTGLSSGILGDMAVNLIQNMIWSLTVMVRADEYPLFSAHSCDRG